MLHIIRSLSLVLFQSKILYCLCLMITLTPLIISIFQLFEGEHKITHNGHQTHNPWQLENHYNRKILLIIIKQIIINDLQIYLKLVLACYLEQKLIFENGFWHKSLDWVLLHEKIFFLRCQYLLLIRADPKTIFFFCPGFND